MLKTLKQSVKPILCGAYAKYCRLRFRGSRTAILCPPIPSENLGDQAMVLGALSELQRRGIADPVLITTGPRFEITPNDDMPFTLSDRYQFFVSEHSFSEECGLLRDMAMSRQLLVFGADVIDGSYGGVGTQRKFKVIEMALRHDVSVRLIGFSISEQPTPEAMRLIYDYSDRIEIYPRDPVTLRRLRDAGVGNLTLAADAAFLMPPAVDTMIRDDARKFVNAYAENLLGLSLHSSFFGKDSVRLSRYIFKLLGELAKHEDFGFLFVPHHPADMEYFRFLEELCPERLKPRCHFVSELPAASVAKRMFACCRHVVTSRMHVAISALSTQTPVICFPYMGKFEGLYEHFNLKDGLIPVESFPAHAKDFAPQILSLISNGARFRDQIASRLPAVTELARMNFRS